MALTEVGIRNKFAELERTWQLKTILRPEEISQVTEVADINERGYDVQQY